MKTKIKCLIFVILMVILDQVIKYFIYTNLRGERPLNIIKGFIEFNYVENRGAAFGIFQGNILALSIVSVIIMVGLVYYIIKQNLDNNLLIFALSLIISGGVGNLIDRVFRGFVVDYISPVFINFAIFNFADILVFTGSVLMFTCLLFFDKERV
ncbi:MAG: signal peptidase II [Oscillospiraceae bacterium]